VADAPAEGYALTRDRGDPEAGVPPVVRPPRATMSTSLLVLTAAGALAGGALLLRTLLVVVRVDGSSMAPALRNGQWVLALRHVPGRFFRRGQVALVAPGREMPGDGPPPDRPTPGPIFLKRIRGLPGDRIETSLDELQAPVRARRRAAYGADGRRVWNVPAGQVFVQGDGPGSDSRAWGPVPWSAVRAIVIATLGGKR